MSIRGSMRGRKGATKAVQPHPPASFSLEQLEPRLLLNADFVGLGPVFHCDGPSNELAILVDIGDRDQNVQESPSLQIIFDLPVAEELGSSHLEEDGEPDGALGSEISNDGSPVSGVLADVETGMTEAGSAATPGRTGTPLGRVEYACQVDADLAVAAVSLPEESTGPVVGSQQDIVFDLKASPAEIRGPPQHSHESLSFLLQREYGEGEQETGSPSVGGLCNPEQSLAPDLPGLVLVDADISSWQGQVIYLDFDEAEGVVYNGPVTVGPFDILLFQAPSKLAGQERAIIDQVLANLQEIFSGSGVIFTIDQPEAGTQYSTIYVGADDAAFAEYGEFLGLAEQVDVGNLDGSDEAIIFSVHVPGESIEEYATAMAAAITHETGHLIGYRHAQRSSGSNALTADASFLADLSLGADAVVTLDGDRRSNEHRVKKGGGRDELALTTSGTIVASGMDDHGQVSDVPEGDDFVALAAGVSHCLALRSDGSIISWGVDWNGRVSDTPTEADFTAIAAGDYHSLALRTDGSIVAWGADWAGQVSGAPEGTGFIAIAGGSEHSLALRSDGSIVAWGEDGAGQVSNAPDGTGFTAIAGGLYHSLALHTDASIVSWGCRDLPMDLWHDSGQVSDTPSEGYFVAIAAGTFSSCALREDGSLAVWGRYWYEVPTEAEFRAVDMSYWQILALRNDGSLVTWGSGAGYIPVPTGSDFTAIAAGNFNFLALQPAYCDLAVTAGTSWMAVAPGGSVAVSAYIENLGTAAVSATGAQEFVVSLYLADDASVDWETLGEDSRVGEFALTELAAHATHTESMPFIAPSQPGTYYLRVCVDDAGAVDENDESNNWTEIITLEVQPPDLVPVLDSSAAPPVATGETTEVSVGVRNSADVAVPTAPEGFVTALYLSDDPNVDWTSLGSESRVVTGEGLASLDAGATHYDMLTFTAPSTVGTYYLRARVDDTGVIDESDESNNWTDAIALEVQRPDLIPVFDSSPALPVTAGETVEVSVGVRNSADVAVPIAPEGFVTALYVSDNPSVDWTSLGSESKVATGQALASLNAGATHNDVLAFTAPSTLGTYYLRARVDDTDVVDESDESNNWGEVLPVAVLAPGPVPLMPEDGAVVDTLSPAFQWTAFEPYAEGTTQSGYHLRVVCRTDASAIVYDTGLVESTGANSHVYIPGEYSGYDNVADCERLSEPLEEGKNYSWSVRYRDTLGNWTQWSEAADSSYQDFWTFFVPAMPVYRFWSPSNTRHFYTISEAEKDYVLATYPPNTWTYEGVVYNAFTNDSEPGLVPVYRFWSKGLSGHFYTISEAEREYVLANLSASWTYEGPVFYVYPEGSQPDGANPIYRFWSPLYSTHFYTISEAEKEYVLATYPADIWTYEGIVYYAYEALPSEASLDTVARRADTDSEQLCLPVGETQTAVPTGAVAPDLPGLELVDPDPGNLQGQMVHLDFDGAEDVVYDGPVEVGPFDVPAFKAPGELAGQERAIIDQVLANLQNIFSGSGVIFTIDQPEAGTQYSTIYVGADDAAFAEYGEFLGLAEQVDISNRNQGDGAFVFSQNIAWDAADPTSFSLGLTNVIAHEVGHLLGFAHTDLATGDLQAATSSTDGAGPLDSVAHFAGPDDGESADDNGPVHQWLTYNAYLYYDSQYAGSELGDFIGDWTDYGSNHHRTNGDDNDVIEGAFDEDVSAPITYIFDDGFHWDIVPQNPLGQDIPYYRHFVAGGDGDEMYTGWGGYESAVTQAEAYWQEYVLDNYLTDSALSYYYLGHVAHLLEDMTVPAHVHNDGHPIRDAYEHTIGEHSNYLLWAYDDSLRTQPAGAIDMPADLTSLFQETIDYTEEYPSDDRDGDDEPGIENTGRHRPDLVSRSDGFSGDGAILDASSYNEITILADDLMPWAMEQTAALYRLFYGYVDETAPTVSFVTSFGLTEGTAVPKPDRFQMMVSVQDDISGYDADGIQFTVERKAGSSWQPVAVDVNGGLFEFTAGIDGLYRVWVQAEDAAGNVGRSATGYFYTDQAQSLAQVFRFWSPVLARHFYTISEAERDYVINTWPEVWSYEGPVFHAYAEGAQPEGTSPVYRFWSSTLTSHFYTISEAEKDYVINTWPDDWAYEGIAYYAYAQGAQPQGTSPVYRFWSGTLGSHFYTISQDERDLVISLYPLVWIYEFTAWYAYAP